MLSFVELRRLPEKSQEALRRARGACRLGRTRGGRTEGREMGAGPRRLTNQSREDEGRCAACSQERQMESAHSPGTAIALDSTNAWIGSRSRHRLPHQSVQSNPRQHVDYRTDPIPICDPSHEKHLLGRFACAMQSVVRLVLQTVVSNERVKKTGCGEPVSVVFVIIAHVNAVTV